MKDIEDQLRAAFRMRADRFRSSDSAWEAVERRIQMQHRRLRQAVKRGLVVAFALLLSTASLLVLWSAFHSAHQVVRPAASESVPPPNPHVVGTVNVGGNPTAVAVADTGVWVTNVTNGACANPSGTLSRIDPASDGIQTTIRLAIVPERVLADAFGSVWVAGYTCTSSPTVGQEATFTATVVRVDPSLERPIATIPIGPSEVVGLTSDVNGVWAAWNSTHTSGLVEIDPANNQATQRVSLSYGIRDIVADGGSIWLWAYGDQATPNGTSIKRVDSATWAVASVDAPGVVGPIVAGNGIVWGSAALSAFDPSAVSGNQTAAVPIDESAGSVKDRAIPVGDEPFLPIAVDLTGVWFVGGRSQAEVAHLNSATGAIDARLAVSNDHALHAVLDVSTDSIWIVDEMTAKVLQVALT